MGQADEAALFIKRFADLAERLAAQDIVVRGVHCLWASFGHWMIEIAEGAASEAAVSHAQMAHQFDVPGPEVVAFWWDGRDQLLTIKTSPTLAHLAPNNWTVVLERPFDSDAALQFVEEFAADHFATR